MTKSPMSLRTNVAIILGVSIHTDFGHVNVISIGVLVILSLSSKMQQDTPTNSLSNRKMNHHPNSCPTLLDLSEKRKTKSK